jgi:hypothetical protein
MRVGGDTLTHRFLPWIREPNGRTDSRCHLRLVLQLARAGRIEPWNDPRTHASSENSPQGIVAEDGTGYSVVDSSEVAGNKERR